MTQGNVLSKNCAIQEINLKPNQVMTTEVLAGEVVTFAEGTSDVKSVVVTAEGQMMITLANGGMMIVKNYAEFSTMDPQPVLQLPNGQRVAFADLNQSSLEPVTVAGMDATSCTAFTPVGEKQAAAEVQEVKEAPQAKPVIVEKEVVEQNEVVIAKAENTASSARQLADIEPAAGDAAASATGVSSSAGFGFQSSFSSGALQGLNAIGTINATALQYNAPDVQQTVTGEPAPETTAEAPTLTVEEACVMEDGSVQMNINAALTDTDGSETLTILISGIGADWGVNFPTDNYTATFNPANNTWSVTFPPGVTSFNGGPILTPPANSDVDLNNIRITAVSTETNGGATSTTTTQTNVIVDAVADAPSLRVQDATANEDQPVLLNIKTGVTDPDGSESISQVTISGVPDGFQLSSGKYMGDGVWVLKADDLRNLNLLPPKDWSGTLKLTVTSTSVETALNGRECDLNNNTATTTQTLNVTINPVADAPVLKVEELCVSEDGAVQMNIKAALTDTDGSESMVIMISGIGPDWGVEFPTDQYEVSYDAANAAWIIKLPAGMTSFSGGPILKPPADSDVDLNDIKVTAVSYETGRPFDPSTSTATTSVVTQVIVDAVADAPALKVEDAKVNEDETIPLKIETAVTDTDGSEKISEIVISGVPEGFDMSAGKYMGGGVWVLQQSDLKDLKLIPPKDWSGTLKLTVTSTSIESNTSGKECDPNNNTATTTQTLTVTVHPQPDVPVLRVEDICIKEDGSGALNIYAAPSDPSESLTIIIGGIDPAWGVDTSQSGGVYDAANGTWTITLRPGQSFTGGPILKPPADSDVDMGTLHIKVVSTDSNGQSVMVSGSAEVIVDAVVDVPKVEAKDITGHEDGSLEVNISASVGDPDGSEEIQVILVKGLPEGFTMSAGEYVGNGVWALKPDQLSGLKLYPPANWSGDIQLSITAVAAEVNLSGKECDFTDNKASASTTINLHVSPCPDAPQLRVEDVCIKEDGSGQLNIAAAPGAPNESLTVTVSGIGAGWSVDTSQSGGTYNAATGTWTITLSPGQTFTGGPLIRPPANSDADLNDLRVTATSTDTNGSAVSVTGSIDVIVDAVVDVPNLSAQNAHGEEGSPIGLSISTSVNDTDGSEVISSVRILGVPDGFTLSAGTNIGGGIWVLTPAQLAGLTLNAPTGWSGNLQLTVQSTATETNLGGQEKDLTDNQVTVSTTLNVNVCNTADPPNLCVGDVCVSEDGSAQLAINASLNDPTESLTITISGIQAGWGVNTSQSGGTYNAATGTWTITLPAGQNFSGGPVFSPPANSDIDLNNLHVTATSSTGSGSSASVNGNANIYVDAVIDPPYLNTPHAYGQEDQPLLLGISAGVTDTDGSERLTSATIHNVPAGFTLVPGTDLGNGIWSVNPSQLSQVCIVPPHNWSGNLSLVVSVTATEVGLNGVECNTNNNQMSICSTLNVCISPVPDMPRLCVSDACVAEDGLVSVNILASLADTDGSERLTVTISGIQPGWGVDTTYSGGSYNAVAGTWTLTLPSGVFNYGGGPIFIPPANSDVDLTGLVVRATATDSNGQSISRNANMNIYVDAVADAPAVQASGDNGLAGQPLDLYITTQLTDTDGSESITRITVSGLPNGASLSAGTNLGNGTWELTAAQLVNLKVITPPTFSGQFTLEVSSTSTETNLSGFEHSTANNSATSRTFADFHVVCGPLAPVLNVETSEVTGGIQTQTFEHVFSTDVIFPFTQAGQVLNAPEALGINPNDLSVDRDVQGQITWVSEGAGYNNTLGYYVVDAAGNITGVNFIFANASANMPGMSFPMAADVEGAGSSLAFFIIADGFTLNNGYGGLDLVNGNLSFVYNLGQADQRIATVNDGAANISLVYTGGDGQSTVLSGPVYHTTDRGASTAINPDGAVHVASGLADANDPNVLRISFEDLPNLGDADYEDIIFDLRIYPTTERTIEPIILSSVVDINDADGNILMGASVYFSGVYENNEFLTLSGGYTVASNTHIMLNGVDTGIVLNPPGAGNPSELNFAGAASIESYEALLASVVFASNSRDVLAGIRVVDYTVTDVTGLQSNLDQVTVTVHDGSPLMHAPAADVSHLYSMGSTDDVAFASLFSTADQPHLVAAHEVSGSVAGKALSMSAVLAPIDALTESLHEYVKHDEMSNPIAAAKVPDGHNIYATLVTEVLDLSTENIIKNGNSVA